MDVDHQRQVLLEALRRLGKKSYGFFQRLAHDRYTDEIELPDGQLCIIHAEILESIDVGGVTKLIVPVTASVGRRQLWAHIYAFSDDRVEVDEEVRTNP